METKQSKVNLFMNELDTESRSIVSYLLIKKHARINELSDLINENDTLTIIKIKEAINPLAEKIFGMQILVFKESAIDISEGRKVLFSWWLENAEELIEEQKKELIDVFDEKDYVKVVMELPDSKNINAKINGNELIITAEKSNEKICRKIPLSADVKKIIGKRYNNSVLEIKLEKGAENV
ncbi:MAG: Hsp20/alpha crystallin family protein [Candidatus Diapherotrites archaeon]